MDETTYPRHAWEQLGRQVKRRRLELGLTQPELSAAGGPATGTISRIETAKQTFYEDRVLVPLERVLGWEAGSVIAVLEGGHPRMTGAAADRSPPTRATHERSEDAETAPARAGDTESKWAVTLDAIDREFHGHEAFRQKVGDDVETLKTTVRNLLATNEGLRATIRELQETVREIAARIDRHELDHQEHQKTA